MIRKYEFNIATNYMNSEWSEVIELEFDDDMTETEIVEQVNNIYMEWLIEANKGGWWEVE